MNEYECCKGCYDHIWGCSECVNAELHRQEWQDAQENRRQAERLAQIEAAVAVFGEEARG